MIVYDRRIHHPPRRGSRRAVARAALVAVVASVATACSADEPASRAFVERLGADTLSIERFTRTADRITGEIVERSPVTRFARYVATLSDDGELERLEVSWETPPSNPEGPPPQSAIVSFGPEGVTMEIREGEKADTVQIEVPPRTIAAIGRVVPPIGLLEEVVRRAAASGEEVYEFAILSLGRSQAAPNRLTRVSDDEVSIDVFGNPMYLRIDPAGRIVGISGRATTMKIEVEPAEGVTSRALASLATGFATRDAAGEGIGVPSPQATVRESGGGARFEVTYSRPAMRGREIWGGLVPFGEVWRTGADVATHFTTDRDLLIGDAEIPAGTYTLWTTFTPDSATLIVNSQTQIWGTAYDPSYDFARVSLESESLPEPVERFTIEIEPTEEGGILRLSWDGKRHSVPMRVR